MLPVFEKRNNLYFYPTFYEGFECSKNVVYTGAVRMMPGTNHFSVLDGLARPQSALFAGARRLMQLDQ